MAFYGKFSIPSSSVLINSYQALTYFLAAGLLLGMLLIIISFYFAPGKVYKEKISVYECGFDSLYDTRNVILNDFSMIALLFIIFDIEVMFLYPWALVLNFFLFKGVFSIFWIVWFFLVILLLSFLYEWARGTLNVSHIQW